MNPFTVDQHRLDTFLRERLEKRAGLGSWWTGTGDKFQEQATSDITSVASHNMSNRFINAHAQSIDNLEPLEKLKYMFSKFAGQFVNWAGLGDAVKGTRIEKFLNFNNELNRNTARQVYGDLGFTVTDKDLGSLDHYASPESITARGTEMMALPRGDSGDFTPFQQQVVTMRNNLEAGMSDQVKAYGSEHGGIFQRGTGDHILENLDDFRANTFGNGLDNSGTIASSLPEGSPSRNLFTTTPAITQHKDGRDFSFAGNMVAGHRKDKIEWNSPQNSVAKPS